MSTDTNIEVKEEAVVDDKDAVIANLTQQFEAMKAKAEQLLDETKKAKAKAREESEAKASIEKEKAKRSGDYEQLLKSSESERMALQNQLQELRDRVSKEKTNNTAMKLAAELADGSNAEILSEFISRRLKYTDDGIKVLDSKGDLTVSGLEDLKREFESSEKYRALVRGSKSTGGGAAGDGGGATGSTVMERHRFDQMSPEQKMKFMRSGGKLINK